MSASIINRDNGTDLERAWWYDAELVALDPDYAALIAEIDLISARVPWCPPRRCEPPRHQTAQPSAPSLRSSEWPTARVAATQRSPPPRR